MGRSAIAGRDSARRSALAVRKRRAAGGLLGLARGGHEGQQATSPGRARPRQLPRPRSDAPRLAARAGVFNADRKRFAATLASGKARVLTTTEAAAMLQVSTKYLRESECVRYVLSATKTLWLDVDLYEFLLTVRFAPAEHRDGAAVACG